MKIETIEDIGKVFVNLPHDLKLYLLKHVSPETFAACCLLLKNGGKMADFISALREVKSETQNKIYNEN